jgi:hypothetical protein
MSDAFGLDFYTRDYLDEEFDQFDANSRIQCRTVCDEDYTIRGDLCAIQRQTHQNWGIVVVAGSTFVGAVFGNAPGAFGAFTGSAALVTWSISYAYDVCVGNISSIRQQCYRWCD